MLAARDASHTARWWVVELWHADGVAHARVELVGQRREPRLARRLGDEVRELLALEQPLPAEHVDAHLADASLALPGCPAAGLRSHPSNLIRFAPAKGG